MPVTDLRKPGERLLSKLELIPMLRPVLLLTGGILVGEFTRAGLPVIAGTALVALALLVVPRTRDMGLTLLLPLLGLFLHHQNRPVYDLPKEENLTLHLVVTESPTQRNNRYRTPARVLGYAGTDRKWHPSRETVYLTLDTAAGNPLRSGDTLLIQHARLHLITNGSLPFDYAGYMARKSMIARLPVREAQLLEHRPLKGFHPVHYSRHIQQKATQRLKTSGLPERNTAILAALLVGDRSLIDPELRNEYSRAGVAHLLAISGLHVGLLYALLNLLLYGWRRSHRMRLVKTLVIVLLLWVYAFITGLAPSVCRAVLMFTLLRLAGGRVTHPVNRYNILVASAFLLLCIRPSFLFDIGFQLSYLAVFSILFFARRMESLFPRTRNRMVRAISGTVVCTLSAQIAVVPLTVYYFGQLPLAAVLTNVVFLLLLTPVMLLGVLYLLTGWTGLTVPLKTLTQLQENFVSTVSGWRFSALENLRFDGWDCLMSYLALALIMLYIELRISRQKTHFAQE